MAAHAAGEHRQAAGVAWEGLVRVDAVCWVWLVTRGPEVLLHPHPHPSSLRSIIGPTSLLCIISVVVGLVLALPPINPAWSQIADYVFSPYPFYILEPHHARFSRSAVDDNRTPRKPPTPVHV